MKKPDPQNFRIAWIVTKIAATLVLTFVTALALIQHSDLALARAKGELSSLLFAASSMALAAFAAIFAIVAIAGWQSIKRTIQEKVEAAQQEAALALDRRTKILELEMKGRALAGLGYMAGEMSIDPTTLVAKDPIRMREAVRLCEQAYDNLRDINEPGAFMALNNLVLFSCALDDRSKKPALLAHANILRDSAIKHDAKNLLLTAARAFLQFGSAKDRQSGREIIKSLELRTDLTERERKEVEIYKKSFLAPRETRQKKGATASAAAKG